MRAAHRFVSPAIVLVLLTVPAHAQEAAGTVAAVEGTAEISRGQGWQALTVGATVAVSDRIRTGKPGRVRIAFRDDTTLNVADGSEIVIGEHVFKPDDGAVSSVIRVLSGKVRALVSEYYEDPQARYQVETATAVSGVRGTDFIVLYRDDTQVTDVVDITGRVEVHGVIDLRGHGVMLTPKTVSTVARGGYPTEPRPLTDAELTAYLVGLEFIGGGEAESMVLDSPIVQDGSVPPEDTGTGTQATGDAGPGTTPGQPRAPAASAESLTPSPRTEEPMQPGDRGTPAGVADQPTGVIERLGEIDVEFDRAPTAPRGQR